MLRVFHTPDVLFQRLFECHRRVNRSRTSSADGAPIFVRRFQAEGHAAGLRAVIDAADGARAYEREGYALIYLTLGSAPRSNTDLGFAERVNAELIELAGGRRAGERLEVTVARCVAKASRAKTLFKHVREALSAGCTAGVVEARTGTPYLDTLVGEEARGLQLVEKLENERILYRPA